MPKSKGREGNIYSEYLSYQNEYTQKYGPETIVFMQIGSFHEAYATESEGYDLNKLSDRLNLTCTRKNKNILEISIDNPKLLGFPTVALDKYLRLLVSYGHTVVVIDQTSSPPNPKREVTQIVSPGTYLGENMAPEGNYIMSIFLEEQLQQDGRMVLCAGMSVIDLSTGENWIHEAYQTNGDDHFALDEVARFVQSYHPREIIIDLARYPRPKNLPPLASQMTSEQILMYLELQGKNCLFNEKPDPQYEKLSFQRSMLEKVFPQSGLTGIIEDLDLEKKIYARTSYVRLLDFAFKHDEQIIQSLDRPEIFESQKHLILGNDALHQLNVFESDHHSNQKIRGLFDLVMHTGTPMGQRLLRSQLRNPEVNPKTLQTRYQMIQEILDQDLIKTLSPFLKELPDLLRIQRLIALQKLHPTKFVDLFRSYQSVHQMYLQLKKKKQLKKMIPLAKSLKLLEKWLQEAEKLFQIDEMGKYHLGEITNSFYQPGQDESLDQLQQEIDEIDQFMEQVCQVLSGWIDDKKGKKNLKPKTKKIKTQKPKTKSTKTKHLRKKVPLVDEEEVEGSEELEEGYDQKVYLAKNETEGYHLKLTPLRAKNLKDKLAEKKFPSLGITENLALKTEEMEYKNAKGGSKITFPLLRELSAQLVDLREQMKTQIQEKYLAYLRQMHQQYGDLLWDLSWQIADLDTLVSAAITAQKFHYTCPEIVPGTQSFVQAKALRHPIVEQINHQVEYVPNDLQLGTDPEHPHNEDVDGMLIYGLNSAGKSTLMKALGLSVIMAQAGMFVPATHFRFTPYRYIFARVTGSDNLFKGLSSFALEMTELKAILKRSGPTTLVIGDEVCKGTEHVSGLAIVASTLIQLADTKASFIFATHLHELAQMKRIQELPRVRTFHLEVHHDEAEDLLVFDRKLKPGSGDSIYGVMVARYIIKEPKFITLAQEIKNDLLGLPNQVINTKKSRYNSQVLMDRCQVCQKTVPEKDRLGQLDTHHIHPQKDEEEGRVAGKPHLPMHSSANLTVLCKDCHFRAHHDKLEIQGYQETSQGRRLKFRNLT